MVRRPVVRGAAATVALAVLALPAASMHLQDPAATDSLPRGVAAVDAAVRMQEAFPGAANPARVVLWDPTGAPVDRPDVRAAIDTLFGGGLRTTAVVGHALVVRLPLPGSGTDPTSNQALEALRTTVLPAAFDHLPGVQHAVGGRTATPHDFAVQLAARTPLVFAFVLL
ncbi:MAG TPA: MMPL family transporter, partial [Umezawaea sp.]|nr:MMPL family transporter [Umezawaea sp.]